MLLDFNVDNCKLRSCLMQVGSPPPRIYTMASESGARVDFDSTKERKDVGVWVTSDMKPSLQFQKATTKIVEALGMMRRPCKYLNRESLTLRREYVRHHVHPLRSHSPRYTSARGVTLYGAASGSHSLRYSLRGVSLCRSSSRESLSTEHPPRSHSLQFNTRGAAIDGPANGSRPRRSSHCDKNWQYIHCK